MQLAGPPLTGIGQLLGLESDEGPTAYDWPAVRAMPTPDRVQERMALDAYAEQAALKRALEAFIQGGGGRIV